MRTRMASWLGLLLLPFLPLAMGCSSHISIGVGSSLLQRPDPFVVLEGVWLTRDRVPVVALRSRRGDLVHFQGPGAGEEVPGPPGSEPARRRELVVVRRGAWERRSPGDSLRGRPVDGRGFVTEEPVPIQADELEEAWLVRVRRERYTWRISFVPHGRSGPGSTRVVISGKRTRPTLASAVGGGLVWVLTFPPALALDGATLPLQILTGVIVFSIFPIPVT